MRIPLKYNIRSLFQRKLSTAMTAFGVALTVAIFISMMGLVRGLDATFIETGHDLHLIVIRQGSLNEVNSFFNGDLFQIIRFLPGVARDSQGEPLASGEIAVIINHPRITGENANIVMRGTTHMGFRLRPEVRIVKGRRFRSGGREIIVSMGLSERFKDLQLESVVHIGRSDWRVVGIFEAGGTAYDSEIWGTYEEISQDWDRPLYSSILLAARDLASTGALIKRINEDKRIHLEALPQKKYFQDQTISSVGIKSLGYFIALLMGIGSCFAAMNTMYAAVGTRSREIGTLRALGFRRASILSSFLLESLLLSLAGGVIGCLLALPMHGISTGTANFMTFSEVVFNFAITPIILLEGVLFAVMVGLLGGFLPARRAARQELMEVLRD
ncbi:MAG: ABC transporter permease [Acidobacteria bacterium]|nr:ABC transporter permease [Acidobacteriota bacterium]